jgi:sarcosine oxidase subunit beta
VIEQLEADVAIIGGGIAGCSAALHLRQAGLSVVLLEKGTCGSQASGVNFGGVRQQGRHPAELPLARRARELWRRLADIVGTDCEFEATGHLKLARSEADMAELEAYAGVATEHDLTLQLIGRNRLAAEYPWLGPGMVGASLSETDGQANPRLVGPAFARAARRAGAEIREHTRVVTAAKPDGRFELATDTGLTVRAGHLLNVAGVWADKIAAGFGEIVPLSPLTPNMIVTEPVAPVISRSIGVCGGDVYARQVARGNIVFGGGAGWGDVELERSRPQRGATLAALDKIVAIIPPVAQALIIRSWSGLDGQMPDHIPVIGPSRTTPGLIHAFGFSGHGFQLGPVLGPILTELVTTGTSPTPLGAFRIDRFAAA